MPTTIVKTVGNGTRDYTTLQAADDAAPANLVSADEVWEYRIYAEGPGTNGEWTLATQLLIGGSTADATRFKRFRAAPGSSAFDNTANPLIYNAASGVAIRSTGSYANVLPIRIDDAVCELDGLQIKSNSHARCLTSTQSGNNVVRATRCLLDSGTGASHTVGVGSSFTNCVILNRWGLVYATANQSTYTNCTIYGSGSGQVVDNSGFSPGTVVLLNCAVFNCPTSPTGVSSSSSYTATDLASFPGTNNVLSLTASAQFVGVGTDYKIKTGSALINAGTAAGAPAADIFTTTRSSVDIGAHELPPANSAPTVSTHPSSITVSSGATATFSAAFAGFPTPTVQWQRSVNSGGSWSDISGATSLSYTTPATTISGGSANNGDQYRCGATNSQGGPVYTNAATLTVNAASDTTPPTLTGTLVSSSIAQTTFTVDGPTATDNVAVSGYDWSIDGGTTWLVTNWPAPAYNFSALSPGTNYQVRLRARDTSANLSAALSLSVTTLAAGATVSSSPLKDNTGALHLSAPFEAFVHNVTTGALVLKKTGLTSDAGTGVVAFADAALVASSSYRVIWRRTDTGAEGLQQITAA